MSHVVAPAAVAAPSAGGAATAGRRDVPFNTSLPSRVRAGVKSSRNSNRKDWCRPEELSAGVKYATWKKYAREKLSESSRGAFSRNLLRKHITRHENASGTPELTGKLLHADVKSSQ